MLTFLTLLLGIVSGPHAIALNAAPDTASIELLLDGNPVEYCTAPPWAFVVDFGSVPAPHHLDAIARNASGDEIGRARQRVNFPQPTAEAALALLPGQGGPGRDETEKELTAFPVRAPDGRLPAPEAMDGWFLANGDPLRVVATEEDDPSIVFVLDGDGQSAFRRMGGTRVLFDATGKLRGKPSVRTLLAYPNFTVGAQTSH